MVPPPAHLGVSLDGNGWLLVGVGGFAVFYMVLRPLMRRKEPLEKGPNFASLSKQRTVEREMQNVLVELAEMTRKISAQLDTRAKKLELLIAEADEKIATLHAMSHASPNAPSARPSDSPLPSVEAPAPVDPRHAQVYLLADQGDPSHEIARKLERPAGEIELILALRSRA